jgi:lambda family phage portal protein
MDIFNKKEEAPKKRYYDAAKVNRLTASWTTQPLTANQITKTSLVPLVGRSRDLYANNDYSRRFIELLISNVVGPKGIALQCTAENPGGMPDTLANNAIEDAWRIWGQRRNCDVTKSLGWKSAQNMFIRTVAVDGECFVRLVYNEGEFRLQFLDSMLVDPNLSDDNRVTGNIITQGIEFDSWGSPVAYYLLSTTSQDSYTFSGKPYVRIPADRMIHGFIPERIGQKRGIPWMATAMLKLKNLGAYEEAAIIAARVGAAKMGFFETTDGASFEGQTEADGTIITDAEPGTFHQLQEGVTLNEWSPTYPAGEFAPFSKAMLRGVSSGLGISYNTLASDLEGVNFSSLRAGVLEDREAFKSMQSFVIESLCQPIFDEFLHNALLTGKIKVGEGAIPLTRKEKFENPHWNARRWSWVDPAKDIVLAKEAIRLGLRSRSAIIRELGADPEEVWQEIATEREIMKDMGVPIDNATQMSAAQTMTTSVTVPDGEEISDEAKPVD